MTFRANTVLKKNRAGGLAFCGFISFYKSLVIKLMCC